MEGQTTEAYSRGHDPPGFDSNPARLLRHGLAGGARPSNWKEFVTRRVASLNEQLAGVVDGYSLMRPQAPLPSAGAPRTPEAFGNLPPLTCVIHCAGSMNYDNEINRKELARYSRRSLPGRFAPGTAYSGCTRRCTEFRAAECDPAASAPVQPHPGAGRDLPRNLHRTGREVGREIPVRLTTAPSARLVGATARGRRQGFRRGRSRRVRPARRRRNPHDA